MNRNEPVTAVDDSKIDYKAAARYALNRVQQVLATKEIEQKVKLELENEEAQEKLNAFEASEVKETKAPSSLSMKLKVISGPSDLALIIFRSKRTKLRRKSFFFRFQKEDVLVNNFGATGQIQLFLVPLDQKLGELTHRTTNYLKKEA